MRLILCVLGVFLFSGCLSYETKLLAQKIGERTSEQERTIILLVVDADVDDDEAVKIVNRAKALTRATKGLSKILGEPKR